MNFKRLKRVCEVTRLGLCPCLFGERFRRQRPQFLPVMEEWQQVELEVVSMVIIINSSIYEAVELT